MYYDPLTATFEDWLFYRVSDSKLVGSVQISDGSMAHIVGYIDVIYRFQDGMYIGNDIEFNTTVTVSDIPLLMQVIQ